MIARVIDGSFTAIMVFLVVSNADGFGKVVYSLASAYKDAVVALQGR